MPGYSPYGYAGNPYLPGALGGYGPAQQPAPAQQIQDGGFVRVRDVEEARRWPVAPGNSVTFKVEGSPHVCTKTMGFSQLEQPRFEVFRLVREEEAAAQAPKAEYALKGDLDKVRERLEAVEAAMKGEDNGA